MNTFSKLGIFVLMGASTALMAAPGGGNGGGERGGERGGRGGREGNYSMLICPNCHHHLLVLSAPGPGGPGGPGRDGERGERGGRRGGMRRGGERGERGGSAPTPPAAK